MKTSHNAFCIRKNLYVFGNIKDMCLKNIERKNKYKFRK